jgi:hypothetical protein
VSESRIQTVEEFEESLRRRRQHGIRRSRLYSGTWVMKINMADTVFLADGFTRDKPLEEGREATQRGRRYQSVSKTSGISR